MKVVKYTIKDNLKKTKLKVKVNIYKKKFKFAKIDWIIGVTYYENGKEKYRG